MKQETLQRLIQEYMVSNGPDVPLYVSSLIEQERVLLEKLADIRYRMRAHEEQYAKERAVLLNHLDLIRVECPHWETTRQSDPSGGSDWSMVCNLCGKQLI